jgi:hypothetical protein
MRKIGPPISPFGGMKEMARELSVYDAVSEAARLDVYGVIE